MGLSAFTPLPLNGVSQYSSDLENILNRAVQIAQIPIKALQNRDSDLLQQKTLLGTLSGSVAALASSLKSLGDVSAGQAISAASSDPSVVGVTNTGSTLPASYVVDSITSAAAAASERSAAPYADSAATPVSVNGTMKLVVGSNQYQFTLASNTLVALRDKINSLGAGVTATILTTSGGNYLSVTAAATGATTLRIVDNPDNTPTQWLTSSNQGANAVFDLNGIHISQSSNVVNSVIPGVTFNILDSSTTPVTISLKTDRGKLSDALESFVSAYNDLRSQLNGQEGPAAGLLSGDTVITQLENSMRHIAAYQTFSGSVKNLSDLGIEFDSAGRASFKQATFDSLTDSQVADAFNFIGSATKGFGAFSKALQEFSDPISGLIKTEQAGLDRTDASLQKQIATLTDRLNAMQTNLVARLQAADSMLAMLESQQKVLSASLQGLNVVLYGKNPNQS